MARNGHGNSAILPAMVEVGSICLMGACLNDAWGKRLLGETGNIPQGGMLNVVKLMRAWVEGREG